MAEFVVSFLLTTRIKQLLVFRQTVKLRVETVHRNQSHATAKLRLSEDKRENRNKEINVRDPEHLVPVPEVQLQKVGQKLGGVVLPPHGMVSILSNYNAADATAANVKAGPYRQSQVVENVLVHHANRYY